MYSNRKKKPRRSKSTNSTRKKKEETRPSSDDSEQNNNENNNENENSSNVSISENNSEGNEDISRKNQNSFSKSMKRKPKKIKKKKDGNESSNEKKSMKRNRRRSRSTGPKKPKNILSTKNDSQSDDDKETSSDSEHQSDNEAEVTKEEKNVSQARPQLRIKKKEANKIDEKSDDKKERINQKNEQVNSSIEENKAIIRNKKIEKTQAKSVNFLNNEFDLETDEFGIADMTLIDESAFEIQNKNLKKFILPKLEQTKFNCENINKSTENVFYAFYAAHHHLFFDLAYSFTIKTSDVILFLQSENDVEINNQINESITRSNDYSSPILKYEIGKEDKKNVVKDVEICIQHFIQWLSYDYGYFDKNSTRADDEISAACQVSFSSDNLEEIILSYISFFRNFIGEYIYPEKIYKNCSIIDAIKTDLITSDMIPRLLIIEINESVKSEYDIKIEIEPSLKLKKLEKKSITLKYQLIWLIDEEGTFVYDNYDSYLYFKNGKCEKKEFPDISSKPHYACFSIKIDQKF